MSARLAQFRRHLPSALAAASLLASGCEAFGNIEEGGATVFVFSTHHATPENGTFPLRGEDQMPRVFQNDVGWTVTLLESYVTTSAVTMVRCGGSIDELTMFWGPCPEDLRDEDLETLTVAGNRVAPGDFCQLEVEYGPYMTPVIDESAEAQSSRHQTPDNSEVMGATIYLRGGANFNGGDPVEFLLRATGSTTAVLDLSNLEGAGNALTVNRKEDFPKELTVSKTYDRFFDGVDFDNWDPAAVEATLLDTLVDQTRVSLGVRVMMEE